MGVDAIQYMEDFNIESPTFVRDRKDFEDKFKVVEDGSKD